MARPASPVAPELASQFARGGVLTTPAEQGEGFTLAVDPGSAVADAVERAARVGVDRLAAVTDKSPIVTADMLLRGALSQLRIATHHGKGKVERETPIRFTGTQSDTILLGLGLLRSRAQQARADLDAHAAAGGDPGPYAGAVKHAEHEAHLAGEALQAIAVSTGEATAAEVRENPAITQTLVAAAAGRLAAQVGVEQNTLLVQ